MFKSVSIKKFRGISNILIPDLKRLNLLVGRNNCGKTSILEALFCVSNPANPSLPLKINNVRNQVMRSEDDWRILFHDLNADDPIQISAEFTSPREERKLTITPHKRSSVAQAISLSGGMVAEQMKGNFSGEETDIIGLDLKSEITEPGQNKDPQKYLANIFFPDTAASAPSMTIPPNYRETTLEIMLLPPAQHGNLAGNFDKAQAEKGINKVVAMLQEIEPKIKDLKMGSTGQIYADIGLSRLIPITVMGGGFVRALATVLAVSSCRDGVLLIDEIEDGFHFSSMDTLWRAIIEAATQYNVQIFATTHSLECVYSFSESCQKYLKTEDDMRLFRIEKKDEQLKAVSFNKTTLSTALQNEWEFR